MRCSTRRFLSSDWVLFAYDILAKQTVWKGARVSSSVMLAEWETLACKYVNLTHEDIQIAHVYQKKICKALKDGDNLPDKPTGLSENALHFLKNVKKVSSYVPHTTEHSKWNRTKIFSQHIRFGKASFWFTFNPVTQNHRIMVYFGTDLKLEVPPDSAARYQQVSQCPGGQAHFFQIC